MNHALTLAEQLKEETESSGNITAMLRQMGYASVPTDYGVYLYLKTRV
ncbi:hypothetical protein EV207_14034 [Scopulibacillus darangshiensis]|uniref:Uncharacterized protein n=1 Tax=Scopulibacillus darangshiensis TaxID=442528 RepID=A0A4R2NKD1_9BACL|nr:hypothetical protein EV207_14034 [Scopulibacillus darangshiensis]